MGEKHADSKKKRIPRKIIFPKGPYSFEFHNKRLCYPPHGDNRAVCCQKHIYGLL